MHQFTIRLDDQLADSVKLHAEASGRSVNGLVVAVLEALVDPELSGSERERVRARLAQAGLLITPERRGPEAPLDEEALRRARGAAGSGTPLASLVSDSRD